MNEIELIRNQLAAERAHARAVANACATVMAGGGSHPGAALETFQHACVDYLVCVLAWFEERDQRLADLARGHPAQGDSARRGPEEALARPGSSREALEKLAGAYTPDATRGDRASASWREFAQFFNEAWSPRRDALDAFLAASARVADWRAAGGIDADSILEERALYARVLDAAPVGITLEALAMGEG